MGNTEELIGQNKNSKDEDISPNNLGNNDNESFENFTLGLKNRLAKI